MGWSAARKLRRAVDALTGVLAIELCAAARALALREDAAARGARPGPASRAAVAAAREAGVGGPGEDRFLAPDLAAAQKFVANGGLVAAVEGVTGPLA